MKSNILYLIVILLISMIILNCSRKDSYEESRVIYEQAIEVHDEVMPRMDRIMQLQKALKSGRENVSDERMLSKIDSSLAALEESHDGMMKWMRDITPIPGNGSDDNAGEVPDPDEMKKIQMKSLESIMEVQRNFNESIRNAEELLESLQN